MRRTPWRWRSAQRLEHGDSPDSIAVLVRTNADAAPILASLDVRGIPRRFSGASGLFAQREIRELLSLLRVIVSPAASEDLYGLLTAPLYGLGGEDLTAICELASRRRRSLWSVVNEVLDQPGLLRLSADTRRAADALHLAAARVHGRGARTVGAVRALRPPARERLAHGRWWHRPSAATTGRCGAWLASSRSSRQQSELLSDPRLASLVPALQGLVDAGAGPCGPSDGGRRRPPCRCSRSTRPRGSSSPRSSSSAWPRAGSRSRPVARPSRCQRPSPAGDRRMIRRPSAPRSAGSSTWP